MPYKNIEDSRANKRRNRAENPGKVYESNKRSHEKRRSIDLEGVRADRRERSRKQRKNNPDSVKNSRLKADFGIGLVEYKAMLDAQGGVCAICYNTNKDGKRLSVDHDHTTGAVRALLCNRCNVVLGLVNESEAILSCMIEYKRDYEVPITEQKVA